MRVTDATETLKILNNFSFYGEVPAKKPLAITRLVVRVVARDDDVNIIDILFYTLQATVRSLKTYAIGLQRIQFMWLPSSYVFISYSPPISVWKGHNSDIIYP